MPNGNQVLFQIPEITDYHYRFYNHFHPYLGVFIEKLNKGELEDLLDIEMQAQSLSFFADEYTINPLNDEHLFVHYFDKKVDFDVEGPYSIYNWELFFHVPLAIAVQLTKNQRFADAQRWFHFIFNPLTDKEEDVNNPPPTARFWNFLPFHKGADAENITTLLENLSLSNSDPELDLLRNRMLNSIAAWRKNPFQPHEVAKFRPLSYQFHVVMKYLDMLIAWGDSLFRQFTIESINEATQVYVIAKNILGPRPQKVPRLSKRPIRNYKDLKNQLDEFGNVLVEMENEFPLNTNISNPSNNGQDPTLNSLLGIGKQLFFCVPHNEELVKYWDIVDDRLFKIRNCMDIEGNVRQLPLFEPPIDPGMLVKAAAGGMSIGDIVGGLNQPVSNVRFMVIFQKALELCNEVRSMGNALLSAIEKGENEKLALIRQTHEIKILELTQDVKYLQWKETEASTEALLKSRETAFQRYRHYQLLLGKTDGDISGLANVSLERPSLTEDNFEEVYANLVGKFGQEISLEEYREEKVGSLGEAKDRVTNNTSGVVAQVAKDGSSDNLQLNKAEDLEFNILMPSATIMRLRSARVGATASLLALFPDFAADAKPLGIGVGTTYGGRQLSSAVSFASQLIHLGSEILSYESNRAAKLASYQRREEDRVNANNLAAKELEQIGKQIITSLIREQSLKKDYENHQVQIEQSRAVDEFIRLQKFSNEGLYLWMQGELSRLYYDCYKLAFDTSKKAEATMKHELMRSEVTERDFIKFNYWDAGRKGLLSGEALYMDLKRMELAYLENNKREFEIVKNVSLQQLDPIALLALKANGACTFDIPEWLYDLDCPGHYMRRIKWVSLSIPGVVGPYTSINCTMLQEKSSIRISPLLSEGEYARTSTEDTRFRDYFGAVQSIVTSNAQNDSGMFELNPKEERFLPFEGSGAISSWRLELPTDLKLRQFDYNKISDVILHIRYTARPGVIKEKATEAVKNQLAEINDLVLARLFDLKHDFPNEWYQDIQVDESSTLTVTLKKEHFPYLVQVANLSDFTFTLNKVKDNIIEPQSLTVTIDNQILNGDAKADLSIEPGYAWDPEADYYLVLTYTADFD